MAVIKVLIMELMLKYAPYQALYFIKLHTSHL